MSVRILFLISIICISQYANSQGCSDAGACSVESLNFDSHSQNENKRLKINLEQTFGLGEKFVFISQTTAGIQYRLSKNSLLELRVPFIYTNGNLGHASGVGDLILSLNQRIIKLEKTSLSIIAASRIKSNDADKSFDNLPLPMAYQTSLGTNDLILGGLFSIPKWDFYLAYQHSFGRNKNSYLNNLSIVDDNKKYYESNKLKRGDDLYFRTRRFVDLKNNNKIILNSLFIYRSQKDEIYKNDEYKKLDGSNGLTLNIAFTYSQNLANQRKIEYSLAFPIIDKNYRPDGLTRNIVLSIRIINL